jgi:hypothetical protein
MQGMPMTVSRMTIGRRIASDFAAAEVFLRANGTYQFSGLFHTKSGWHEVMTSGLYASADAAEADAGIWVTYESENP